MRLARIAVLLAVSIVATGCGGNKDETETETTTAVGKMTTVRVYWLRDGKVWPVARKVDTTGGVTNAAVAELLVGPTAQEQADLHSTTAIPEDVQNAEISIANGVADVKLSGELPDEALSQLVYTLTQFPDVESVKVQDRTLTRADFEDLTPSILVESPLPFEKVTSPLHARGTANTFEATFNYEVTDTDGKIVAHNFVTATSGTGTRGTFEFTAPFTVPFDGVGELIVFELSAENGKRIHLVEIPLRMTKAA
jgi:germination protein M